MKIVHIIQMMKIGGAQQTLINIIKGTRQHEHIIYSTLNEYSDTLNTLSSKFINSSAINIYRVLEEELPDIVDFHWWPGVYEYNFKRIRKISKINFRILVTVQDPERLQNDIGDFYVFCSKFVKNQQHGRIKIKGKVILDYIDNDEIFKIPKMTKKANEISIVRHSMIYPNKIDINILNNTAEILESLQKKHNKKIVFTICGDGDEYREKLKDYCEERFPNLIKFQTGQNIFDTLSRGDIYLYNTPSSSVEGFSNAISEAQAMGLPVVADNKGGNIEQIQNEGFLCTDWKDVKLELNKLVESPTLREKFGELSRKKIINRGGLDALYEKYNEVFLESWNI